MRRLGIALGLVIGLPAVAAVLYAAVLFWNGGRASFPPEASPAATARPVEARQSAADTKLKLEQANSADREAARSRTLDVGERLAGAPRRPRVLWANAHR